MIADIASVGLLALQVVVILAVARLVGMLFAKLQQPQVVGEMFAGIAMGPSLFGAVAPTTYAALFPAVSMPLLRNVGELGVLLFMFVVGTEMDSTALRVHTTLVAAVALCGIVVPFISGAGLAFALYRHYAPPSIQAMPFVLFIATAMSITAFPVLARIVADRGLLGHEVGQTALACAALGDALAWLLLAVSVSVARLGSPVPAVAALVGGTAFASVVVLGVRRMIPSALRDRPALLLPAAFGLLAVAALITNAIGLHAIFGAFIAGVGFSQAPHIRESLQRHLDAVAYRVPVPLFFAFAGLRTDIGRLRHQSDALVCLGVVAVAVAVKFGACTLAARWRGVPWRAASMLGALMNTRGLMELLVLNVGYDLGILPPTLFTVFVIMAVVTTCMTGPVVSRLQGTTHVFALT